ncbi:uncharacterized protein DNG_06604 [Cephalotrichum gorgonifer]|uniref:DASH complex subunit DAD2 n=1 Tax=Cephalotrichum gorgonifer TaxID=2041049 RepID=A0AAE8MZZ3_9PEZI|nr:uncharacterized protein DNG_06604 [Cephalotrichum gorgonifer]
MSLPPRPFSSHLRGSSVSGGAPGPSPALLARIEEKKAELENLKQLRDLSAEVANQMAGLEQKLSTLSDGTEAIATVMGNWHNVLRAISMASSSLSKASAGDDAAQLPQTLVRIPTEHAPALQAQAEAAAEENQQAP